MNFDKYLHLTDSQISKCLYLVDNGMIKSVVQPTSSNPVIVESNQLIRDYINYLNK